MGALEDDGYVTTSVLDGDTIDLLRKEFDALGVDDVPFYASSVDADRETAMRLHRLIREAVEPCLQGVLPGWQGFLGAFLSKAVHTENVLSLHQDWTYVDEAEHRSYIAWCPLVDTSVEGGTLHVVPGSHRWLANARGSGFPSPFRDVEPLLLDEALVAIPLPAGDAVIYDSALLHASPPNRSGGVRPVAGLAMAPPDAALIHHHTEGDGTATVHEIDEWYYTRQAFATVPEYPVIATHPVVDTPVTEAQVRTWLS